MKKSLAIMLYFILIVLEMLPIPDLSGTSAYASTTPPVTTISINGSSTIDNIYYGQAKVSLSASDSGSGVSSTQFSLKP